MTINVGENNSWRLVLNFYNFERFSKESTIHSDFLRFKFKTEIRNIKIKTKHFFMAWFPPEGKFDRLLLKLRL